MMSRTLPLSEAGGQAAILEAGQGEPLVLVHGVGLCAHAWGPQIEMLSRNWRVLAVDMPGHGGSEPLPRDARLPDFVAWLIGVLQGLDVGPVNLAGHSMGALIAAGVAIERPDLVKRLAVLNAVYRRSPEARASVLARAEQLAVGKMDNEAPLSRWFTDRPAEQQARASVAGWLQDVDPQGYATAYRAFAEGDALYADRWAQIRCPTLALTGADDPNSTPAMAEAMAAAARDGEVRVIAGERHMVNLTAPEVVNEALRRWLARVPQSQEAEV
ncbi:alpha/beta fold hydrolase [Aquibaculum arenosum]|uniref:Alpha/beta hydrolase n=1 Tax=Aquibaculum arenosum TaxID=3032591 RepID=A0ABT5YR52_9PROT|nr:alpha/beta hydrolase [Fodinicurvata sp. CAU 1616]MDF2097444.1 alpha/beta hydrolase [Fodinicurvata sp. CAU 1616]